MINYNLAEESLGYQTSNDPSNSDKRLLVAGSKNTLIDYQKKVKTRGGYTRLGDANTDLNSIRNAWTWNNSGGNELPQRFYDDELEVYLGTVDDTEINDWVRVSNGWSTTEKLRPATWFDSTENIDLQIMVQGDDNLYEWNGAIAVVGSITGTTVTKAGTTTFAENRFYTTRNKVFVCVRTGTEYTYTGGETSTTLTGIADTTGLVAGDILVQKIVTTTDKPVANFKNHFIFTFENQIAIGSKESEEAYLSNVDDYSDFSFSSPRAPAEGALFTFDDPTRAINGLGEYLLFFNGLSSVYRIHFEQLAIGSSLTETVKVKKLDTGINQGALSHEAVVPIGNSLAYLSNEVALRIIENPDDLVGINPRTFSNPIKPDFDEEEWDEDAFGFFYKSILIYTVRSTSRMYMLNFIEDANGKLTRFWNPPQVLPVGAMSVITVEGVPSLHGHSNSIPETYKLFDGQSDGQYEGMDPNEKLPIHCIAKFALNNMDNPANLKNLDQYYIEGEITPNTTDLILKLNYDYEGATQIVERTIDGSDEGILEGNVGFNSLAQQSLGVNPLGGLFSAPSDARKFRVDFEIAKEDFHEIQDIYETNDVDIYWAITRRGSNAKLSRRKNTVIRR